MMTRRGILGGFAGGLAILGLTGCGSTRRLRYKMTVEVETPSGPVAGSSVREVVFDRGDSWFPLGESKPRYKLIGEAVAVDLPGGRTLFALLTSAGHDGDYAKRLPADQMGWSADDEPRQLIVELWPNVPLKPRHGPASIPSYLPLLVTFRDIADPKSVETVDPDDLASHFGEGVRLRRIIVEETGESVTAGIGSRLGWLGNHPEPRLDSAYRGSANPSLSQKLAHGDFRQGTPA